MPSPIMVDTSGASSLAWAVELERVEGMQRHRGQGEVDDESVERRVGAFGQASRSARRMPITRQETSKMKVDMDAP